jgi:hypothetical protein
VNPVLKDGNQVTNSDHWLDNRLAADALSFI